MFIANFSSLLFLPEYSAQQSVEFLPGDFIGESDANALVEIVEGGEDSKSWEKGEEKN